MSPPTKFNVSYRKQFRTVLLFEIVILGVVGSCAYLFWNLVCSDSTWGSCVGAGTLSPFWFVVYAIIRPVLFTPILFLALIAGSAYGPYWGSILAAFGATLSCLFLYLPAKYIGRIYVKPFLSTNLPAMWRLLRTQDYKVVFLSRWIPFVPFDLFSILFGVADFRLKSVIVVTFFGILPECFMFARMSTMPTESTIYSTLILLFQMALVTLVPLFAYELVSRKRGSSLWSRLKNVYRELIYEIRANNDIVKREIYRHGKPPVILLYGFFSSRRALTVMERVLENQGHQVMSFNLGGLFGVFFTSSIQKAAALVDKKITKQIDLYEFDHVNIVAHSKGGLVAMWWLLKLGGAAKCRKLITLGTPFRGSIWTYLALITPLGFIWRDVWEMRPGSDFLKELRHSRLPESTTVYCMHSEKDKVSTGDIAIYTPDIPQNNVIPVAMNNTTHFEFLYKRDVCEKISELLSEKLHEDHLTSNG